MPSVAITQGHTPSSLLTRAKTMRALGLSAHFVSKLANHGQLVTIMIGGRRYFTHESVIHYRTKLRRD